jgi:hypothetical protein
MWLLLGRKVEAIVQDRAQGGFGFRRLTTSDEGQRYAAAWMLYSSE